MPIPSLPKPWPLLRRTRSAPAAWIALATALLMALGALLAYRWSLNAGIERLADVATERLELYAAALESELGRLAYLPAIVAIDGDLMNLFAAPGESAVAQASLKLARLNARAGALRIYATREDGTLLARSDSSNNGASARALTGRLERIARALQTQEHGFFAASDPVEGTDFFQSLAVRGDGRVIGWIIVQINLAPLESTWVDLGVRTASEKLLVVDANDVVIMSSVPPWRYRTLTAVAEHWQADLVASVHYPQRRLASLGLHKRAGGGARGALLVDIDATPQGGRQMHLAQERVVVPQAVTLMALSDPTEAWREAARTAWVAAAGAGFMGLAALYLLHRRRALVQLTKARNALQHARDELEHQVELRTGELRHTNDELKRQIEQRERAEHNLIQAGKLAVLGQMSAGMAHEINQPLTALRALSGNTLRLLEAGREADAAHNLRQIGEVVERMGRVTSQLKTFARRVDDRADPVLLGSAVANALLLLDHRVAAEAVEVEVLLPEDATVLCEATRLEQVLVNLVSNALDAMAGARTRRLRISAAARGGRLRVCLCDSGQGMDDAALARLFEPFFTTKPAGQGLGLGLVISSKIVNEFGGELRARRGDEGMIFEFDLALAEGP